MDAGMRGDGDGDGMMGGRHQECMEGVVSSGGETGCVLRGLGWKGMYLVLFIKAGPPAKQRRRDGERRVIILHSRPSPCHLSLAERGVQQEQLSRRAAFHWSRSRAALCGRRQVGVRGHASFAPLSMALALSAARVRYLRIEKGKFVQKIR